VGLGDQLSGPERSAKIGGVDRRDPFSGQPGGEAPGLLEAALGQRRVEMALVASLDIPDRLGVPRQEYGRRQSSPLEH
jgi:hypothetical protein